MKFNYRINTKEGVIIETWPDEFEFKDYKEFKERELIDPDYNSNYNIVSDLRRLKMGFNDKMIELIVDFISQFPGYFIERKSAIITNSPEQVVNSISYIKKIQATPVNVNIFSTPEAALRWVKEKDPDPEISYPGKLIK
jgi:hypothetical protein